MKWKIYFTVVGIVALLLIGYQTDIWAKLTQGDTEVEHLESKEQSSYLNASKATRKKQTKEEKLDKEFTVINKSEDMNSDNVEKQKKDTGIVPAHIKIPAIDVDTNVHKVGILDNGQMGVPDDTVNVGWFEPGTKPGSTGNAVIAGHVDSYEGPAVFFYLKNLKKGDEVHVTGKEGKKLTYVVKALESYPYDNAPIKDIFGHTDKKRLNLITCTGTFDHDTDNHLERLVVFTELKEPKEDKQQAEIKDEQNQPEKLKAPDHVEVSGTFVTWHAVRDKQVIGYRVYRSKDGENFEKVASVSSYERKNYTDPHASEYTYYVTSVDQDGSESDPSKKVSAK
ncbi:sortase [Halobacillus salinarum]|uniref:Sortase n=1 Tax=Halobacillus salinarum TaxID=2932257 RepID=A0ABY4ELQ8_9BACI|nr:sortase [Halobacillus salinarum]UOQ45381.1 sortase [Halobacillus salinarum]